MLGSEDYHLRQRIEEVGASNQQGTPAGRMDELIV